MAGVAVALLTVTDSGARAVGRLSVEAALTRALGAGGYQLLGLAVFVRDGRPAVAHRAGSPRSSV